MDDAALQRAVAEAARLLAAEGLTAEADGERLRCTFPDGKRAVVHARLAPDSARLNREALLQRLAEAMRSKGPLIPEA